MSSNNNHDSLTMSSTTEDVNPSVQVINEFLANTPLLKRLREELDRLREATDYYEELVAGCLENVEDSTTATSNYMKELNKRLKRMERNIENSRCTLNEENHDFKPPVSKYKSLMEHGGRLLEAVLSEKPSNEPMEDFLDKLAIRLVELAHPLTPMWMNPSSPGSPVHSDSKSDIGQHPSPSSSTSRASRAGSGTTSQSLSTTIPASLSDSDMLVPLDGPFSELHPLDQMVEVPTSPRPSISLLDEMRHVLVSGQQMAPPRIPVRQLISKVDFIKNIQLALNGTLKLLKAHKMTRVDLRRDCLLAKLAGFRAYIRKNPLLQDYCNSSVSCPVYSCILYIQEAISMATKVDSEDPSGPLSCTEPQWTIRVEKPPR